MAGKSRLRSKTSEEAEEEPERRGAPSAGCGEDGTEKQEQEGGAILLTGCVSGTCQELHA